MKNQLLYFILSIAILFSQFENEKLYVTIQMMDQVGVINTQTNQIQNIVETEIQDYIHINSNCMDYTSEMECSMSGSCEWMMGMCMESQMDIDCMDYTSEMECSMSGSCEWMMGMCMEFASSDMNTPHFIVFDEVMGYWFTTTIASGYIAQFSLIDNEFIDAVFVGDAPAILTIDVQNKKLYSSRMMPMNGMGNMMPSSESNIIQSLDYSNEGLSLSAVAEYEINSPAPHGIAISDDGAKIYTASNTADWLYEIDISSGQVIGVAMDSNVSNPSDQPTLRLKPIQCLVVGNKLFVTCSAGIWMNPWTGEQSIIPGQLQMWNTDNMTLIDFVEFGNHTAPWHIVSSPNSDKVYVALGGDNLYDTEGVASVIFSDNDLEIEWQTGNELFDTLHGIDVSANGEKIYVSGRGDGYIHILNNAGEYISNVFIGSMSMLGGINILKKQLPSLGDSNNDSIINVVDIIQIINFILDNEPLSPYSSFSSDFNNDSIINILDITGIVNLIIYE